MAGDVMALLPQSHGFEGFGAVGVGDDSSHLARTEGVQMSDVLMNVDPGNPAPPVQNYEPKNRVVIDLDQVLHFHSDVLPGVDQTQVPPSEPDVAPIDPANCGEAGVQLDLRIALVQKATELAGVERIHQPIDRLNVLLRHRPPSIPLGVSRDRRADPREADGAGLATTVFGR